MKIKKKSLIIKILVLVSLAFFLITIIAVIISANKNSKIDKKTKNKTIINKNNKDEEKVEEKMIEKIELDKKIINKSLEDFKKNLLINDFYTYSIENNDIAVKDKFFSIGSYLKKDDLVAIGSEGINYELRESKVKDALKRIYNTTNIPKSEYLELVIDNNIYQADYYAKKNSYFVTDKKKDYLGSEEEIYSKLFFADKVNEEGIVYYLFKEKFLVFKKEVDEIVIYSSMTLNKELGRVKRDKENYLEKLDELIEKGSTVEFRFVKIDNNYIFVSSKIL